METTGGNILSRLGEKTVGWLILGLLVFLGIAIYRMPAETKSYIWNCIWRSAGWVAIAVAVPWSSKLFIRRVMDVGANWAGLVLVASLTAVDIIAGVLLMTGWPSGFWPWAATIVALGVAATYNYLVTEYLADMAD